MTCWPRANMLTVLPLAHTELCGRPLAMVMGVPPCASTVPRNPSIIMNARAAHREDRGSRSDHRAQPCCGTICGGVAGIMENPPVPGSARLFGPQRIHRDERSWHG